MTLNTIKRDDSERNNNKRNNNKRNHNELHISHTLNPLIDKHTVQTLKNIQAMVTQIQAFAKKHFNPKRCQPQCPATELYVRLLMMLNEAIEHERV